MIHVIQQSSLEKIKANAKEFKPPFESSSVFCDEEFAYQIVLYSDDPMGEVAKIELKFVGEVKLYEVRQAPVEWPHYAHHTMEPFLADDATTLPDILQPLKENPTLHVTSRLTVLWVQVKAFFAGDYNVNLHINGEHRSRFALRVLSHVMPKGGFTNSQYIDPCSIARVYDIPLFCDKHWSLLGKYMKMASSHGVTHILTPIYPPVYGNAPFGSDSIQLVRIRKEGSEYFFSFDLLDSWIAVAKKNGINKFVFPPIIPSVETLRCPDILVTEDGEEVSLFTDEKNVLSREFAFFIRLFLRHLLKHLKEIGVHYDVAFQFTHAPSAEMEGQYVQCRTILGRVIRGQQIADTMAPPDFVELNVGSAPFFSSAKIKETVDYIGDRHLFLDHKTPGSAISPFIASPATRMRSFGALAHRYRISSLFNLWFNYYPESCAGIADVFTDTTCHNQMPSGGGFLVYPGPDGPIASIRLKQLHFALQDLKRLYCLERFASRRKIEAIIDKKFKRIENSSGYDPDQFIKLYEEICSLLQK